MKSKLGYEYDLIEALRSNPHTIMAGDDICGVAADTIEALRARVAELEKRLADCIVWMDSREKMVPGMPRLCDMARDALRARVAELEAWKERHLHDALGELQRMGQAEEAGWQPIETAPKDGTQFMLWFSDGKETDTDLCLEPICKRDEDGEFRTWGRVDYDEEGWLHLYDFNEGWRPTHWRPLPAPPTEGDA